MKLGKRKVVFYLFFVTCSILIARNFYDTIKKPQNGYNVNNQIHLNAFLQSRKNNGIISSERTYSNNTEQRRIAYGIQISGGQANTEQRRLASGIQMSGEKINTEQRRLAYGIQMSGEQINTEQRRLLSGIQMSGKQINTEQRQISSGIQMSGEQVNTEQRRLLSGIQMSGEQVNREQRRISSGIQMSGEQIKIITETLPKKGNLLVWGLGNDSPYWHNSTKGKVVFIEDDIPLRKAGIMWYDNIVKQYSFLEVYRVHYTTNTVESFKKYINSPEIWSQLDLSNQLPASVTRTHWHVIIIDAPLGCCQKGPGRYQSIYTSRVLGSKGTHVFVDDFERKVEHEFSIKVFGKPVEVIQRRTTNASLANEQAHFILSSYNQTRIGQVKETKPDISITPVLNIAENVTNNWTILLTVNSGFFDFFENWWWHFKKLYMSLPVSVVAEDDIVFEKLTNLNDSSIKVHRSEHISISKAVNYGSTLYKKIVSARPTYILMFLKNGTNVIYSDLDTVWLQNPLPYLEGNFDIRGQLDSNISFCTGFLAIRSNEDTLKFIQKWEDALRDEPNLNQEIFNRLVRKSSVNIKALNSKKFPSGKQYFNQFSKEERLGVVVVHNNFIIGHDKKVKRFKNMNLWVNRTFS